MTDMKFSILQFLDNVLERIGLVRASRFNRTLTYCDALRYGLDTTRMSLVRLQEAMWSKTGGDEPTKTKKSRKKTCR